MSAAALPPPPPAPREIVISPQTGWVPICWSELWEHRELLWMLVSREVTVRYKQTVLGVTWAILQPVLSMAIFTLIFGQFAKMPSEGAPYPIFVYAGLLPWTFFSVGVSQAGQSLINQQALLTKIYLPRLFVPAAPLGSALCDLAVSFPVFAVLMLIYQHNPGWSALALPFLVLVLLMAALGMSLILSALTVTFRDFRYVIPFMLQIWMYISPVVYPASIVPEHLRWCFALNPLAGIIDGFRSALLGRPFDWPNILISTAASAALLCWGLFYFKKTERRFADIA